MARARKRTKQHTKAKPRAHRKAPKTGLTLLNLKVSDQDRRVLNAQAKRYANGNLSQWLRFAGTRFRPAKSRLTA